MLHGFAILTDLSLECNCFFVFFGVTNAGFCSFFSPWYITNNMTFLTDTVNDKNET